MWPSSFGRCTARRFNGEYLRSVRPGPTSRRSITAASKGAATIDYDPVTTVHIDVTRCWFRSFEADDLTVL